MDQEKKKIVYITVRSDFGGGPYHVDLLINNLVNEFDIYVAAPLNKPYGITWKEKLAESKFLELPFRSFKINSFFKLVRFVKKNKIEIIHAHGKGAGIYGRLVKIFIPGIVVIYTFHGFHILHYSSLTLKFYILAERFLNRFTDQFINVSEGEKEICLQYNIFKESKSLVIYNGIKNIESIKPYKNQLRNKLNLPAEAFVIISVVRLNHQKNIKATINIAKILSGNKDVLFLIIGEGEEREEIESIIGQNNLANILMPGYKSNINEYLAASDIYLSTSLWEGLPYSLIEAARVGLPIIASDVTGNNEIVTDGKNGYLFQPNNLHDAVDKILKIKNSVLEQNFLAEHSIKIFNEKFQLDSMINRIKEAYNHLGTRS